jgi:hypothetical protein
MSIEIIIYVFTGVAMVFLGITVSMILYIHRAVSFLEKITISRV